MLLLSTLHLESWPNVRTFCESFPDNLDSHLSPPGILNLAFPVALSQAASIAKKFSLDLTITSNTTSRPLYSPNLRLLVLTVYFYSSFP